MLTTVTCPNTLHQPRLSKRCILLCASSIVAADLDCMTCCAGQLPSAWSSMKDMQYFEAYDNNISGGHLLGNRNSPPYLSRTPAHSLPMLTRDYQVFDTGSCAGPLPESWSAWSSVYTMYLNSNALTGICPPHSQSRTKFMCKI